MDDFQDPLENYEPPVIDDPLERAIAEEPVTAIRSVPFTSVAASTNVAGAIRLMAEKEIGLLLVAEDERLVGVFGDRDILDRIALEYDEKAALPLRDVMTTDPVFVRETDSVATVLGVMALSSYRHVPVVDDDGRLTGIVSPRRMTEFLKSRFEGRVRSRFVTEFRGAMAWASDAITMRPGFTSGHSPRFAETLDE